MIAVTYLDPRPPLNPGLRAVLRRRAQALADDFGPDGWRIWLSDAEAGHVYGTWDAQLGRTWDALTTGEFQKQITKAMADGRAQAERLLAGRAE